MRKKTERGISAYYAPKCRTLLGFAGVAAAAVQKRTA
jgi:hypothetical protein